MAYIVGAMPAPKIGQPKPRDADGNLLRADGKVDMRSTRPPESLNMSGLIAGWPDGAKKRQQKREDREAALETRACLLKALREIAADTDEGGARMKAIELLLKPEAGDSMNRCWKCRGDLAAVPPSVQTWIDGVGVGESTMLVPFSNDQNG